MKREMPKVWKGEEELGNGKVLEFYAHPYIWLHDEKITKIDLHGCENIIIQKHYSKEVELVTDNKHHIVVKPNFATGYLQYHLVKDNLLTNKTGEQ